MKTNRTLIRASLEGIDPKTPVIVYHETDCEMELYEVYEAKLAKGYPRRNESTRAAVFEFDENGPESWLFIQTEEA